MKVNDAHVHLFNRNAQLLDAAHLLAEMDAAGVDKIFVMARNSHPGVNEALAEDIAPYRQRMIPFAFINPWEEDAVRHFADCVEKLGMRGLKLHPVTDAFPADRFYLLDPLMEIADTYGLHTIIHCTSEAPYSSPLMVERLAQRWPRATIQMAHMGACWNTNEGIEVCKNNPNIYLDGATVSLTGVQRGIAACPDKFLMGSDTPFYHFALEKMKIELATQDEAVRKKVLYENMERLIAERRLLP